MVKRFASIAHPYAVHAHIPSSVSIANMDGYSLTHGNVVLYVPKARSMIHIPTSINASIALLIAGSATQQIIVINAMMDLFQWKVYALKYAQLVCILLYLDALNALLVA